MYAVNTEEAVGNGGARVSRCGYEDIHLAAVVLTAAARLSLLAQEILQQTRHEACADILEGECGTVEEFEGVDVVRDFDNGAVELKRIIDDVLERNGINVFSEETVCHGVCYLLEREVLYCVEELLRQGLDALGHVEPLVFCQSLDDGFLKCCCRGFMVCGVVVHFLFVCGYVV